MNAVRSTEDSFTPSSTNSSSVQKRDTSQRSFSVNWSALTIFTSGEASAAARSPSQYRTNSFAISSRSFSSGVGMRRTSRLSPMVRAMAQNTSLRSSLLVCRFSRPRM
jgi:hypothetical protein